MRIQISTTHRLRLPVIFKTVRTWGQLDCEEKERKLKGGRHERKGKT